MSGPIYFDSFDGTRYRVLDAVMCAGAALVSNAGVPWATARIFRAALGHRRLYQFITGEGREFGNAQLARQLAAAESMPTTQPASRLPVSLR